MILPLKLKHLLKRMIWWILIKMMKKQACFQSRKNHTRSLRSLNPLRNTPKSRKKLRCNSSHLLRLNLSLMRNYPLLLNQYKKLLKPKNRLDSISTKFFLPNSIISSLDRWLRKMKTSIMKMMRVKMKWAMMSSWKRSRRERAKKEKARKTANKRKKLILIVWQRDRGWRIYCTWEPKAWNGYWSNYCHTRIRGACLLRVIKF